jgi:hypothetical protein
MEEPRSERVRTAFALLLAILVLGASAKAGAATVTYTLNDITFDDGGTVTGFFSRDTSNLGSSISNFDVKVTAGSRLPAFEFSSATTDGGIASLSLNLFDPTFPLSALFLAGSTAAGRHIELGLLADPLHPGINQLALDCLSMLCSADLTEAGLIRFVTGGTVAVTSSIPEPSTLVFIAPAVALLALLGFKRRC